MFTAAFSPSLTLQQGFNGYYTDDDYFRQSTDSFYPTLVSPVVPHYIPSSGSAVDIIAPSPVITTWLVASPLAYPSNNDISPFTVYNVNFASDVALLDESNNNASSHYNPGNATSNQMFEIQQPLPIPMPIMHREMSSTEFSEGYNPRSAFDRSGSFSSGSGSGEGFMSGSCHQCKKRRDDVVPCSRESCRKKYCAGCLTRIYNFQDYSGGVCCPACQGVCNCARCSRKSNANNLSSTPSSLPTISTLTLTPNDSSTTSSMPMVPSFNEYMRNTTDTM